MNKRKKILLQERMTRRSFLYVAGVGSSAAFLAACGNPVSPTSAPPTAATGATAVPAATSAPTAAPADASALSFWAPGGSDEFIAGLDQIGMAYQKLNPAIKIAPTKKYSGDESFREVLLANIAAGTPPDSAILWDAPVPFAVRGALEPLDDLMANSKNSQRKNWPAGVLASTQYKGKTYGLPVTAGPFAIFFNQEMFDAKGIPSKRADFPKTWDELRKISKEFTRWNGDTLETAGFIPFGNPGDPGTQAVELAVWSALNGSQHFDEKNVAYTIDSPQNVEMMQYAVDWLNEEYKGDYTKVKASGNWTGYEDSQARPPLFQAGKLGMLVNGFWFTTDFYGAASTIKSWEVAPFPVGPSGKGAASGYWPNWLVIPKGSKRVQDAFSYFDYMGSEGMKVWFMNVSDIPTNSTVPTDLVPTIVAEKRGAEFAQQMTNFCRDQLKVATPMWTSPVQDYGNDQIARAIERIMSKTATPKDALAEAQKLSQAELEKALKP